MLINRRSAVRNLLVFSAGVALLPSCMQDTSKSSILLKNVSLTGKEEKLLAALAETIIPTTEAPGAKEIGSHLFAMTMLDDCYSKGDQQKFIEGMRAFEQMSDDKGGGAFAQLSAPDRSNVLEIMESRKKEEEPVDYFYRTMKRLTIQSYVTSKYYLTKVQVYELIPSRWHGCVPVKSDLKKAS
jgi:Gluconate 2-dehydrogenase subunit 3